jgi:hypothetical protein
VNGLRVARFDSYQQCAAPSAPSGIHRQSGAFIARRIAMMDVVMLAIGFVFFAVSIAYVYACDQL